MDEKFLEFWGNLLLNAAKGKKQTDDLMQWLRLGLPGMTPPSSINIPSDFPEMVATFQKLYGLDRMSEKKEDPQKIWADALKEFQKSFQDYLTFSGVISRKEHLALVEKYEKLKARCSDQEETIRHLRMLLAGRKGEQSDAAAARLQDIAKNQGEIFQKMMRDFSQYFTPEKPASETREGSKPDTQSDTKREEERQEEDDQSNRPGRDT